MSNTESTGSTAGNREDRGSHRRLDAPLAQCLDDKAKTIDVDEEGNRTRSGAYVRDLERVIPEWIEWMVDHGYETFEDLDGQAVGEWARSELAERTKQGDISASTAWKYYRLVSAYLSYCSGWEYIAGNPAETEISKAPMPNKKSGDSGDKQYWSPEQRAALMEHVEQRAYEAIDERGDSIGAFEAVRDRALCAVIGYSGARGAELLNASYDDRDGRSGATWSDVDLENRKINVLGKSQNREDVPTTGIPVEPIERWRHLLDPPSDEWPIFPTFHSPTLWRALREQLADAGVDDDRIDDALESYRTPLRAFYEVADELDIDIEPIPPALSTSGGRSIMERLTGAAGVDVEDDPHGYLALHGARRGAGEAYRRESGLSDAQKALRHSDPAITENMYSHVEASEVSETGDEVFEGER